MREPRTLHLELSRWIAGTGSLDHPCAAPCCATMVSKHEHPGVLLPHVPHALSADCSRLTSPASRKVHRVHATPHRWTGTCYTTPCLYRGSGEVHVASTRCFYSPRETLHESLNTADTDTPRGCGWMQAVPTCGVCNAGVGRLLACLGCGALCCTAQGHMQHHHTHHGAAHAVAVDVERCVAPSLCLPGALPKKALRIGCIGKVRRLVSEHESRVYSSVSELALYFDTPMLHGAPPVACQAAPLTPCACTHTQGGAVLRGVWRLRVRCEGGPSRGWHTLRRTRRATAAHQKAAATLCTASTRGWRGDEC